MNFQMNVLCSSVDMYDAMCFLQVQYEMWRRVLKHFWMVVVAYSMTVLILIYVYQFKSVCSLFQQILGVSEER